ncbi:DUF6941 family protein [Bacillus altitudinis]|uniref:DUF6941 family protein n=1 Tax=Bacillus altitudinis TaxID=293387 RepID=UPI003CF33A85
MYNIGYAVICESAFNNGKQIIIKNPYSVISPVNIPGNFSFDLAFSIIKDSEPSDGVEDAQLKFRLEDPEGRVVVNSETLTIKVVNEENKNFLYGDANFNFANVEFFKEGNFNLKIVLDGVVQKEVEIPVIRRDRLKE